jgi:hypothetical protein
MEMIMIEHDTHCRPWKSFEMELEDGFAFLSSTDTL